MSEPALVAEPEPRPARSRWWLFGVGIVVALGIVAAAWIVVGDAQRKRDALQVRVCRESNLPNAYIRLVLEHSPNFDARKLGLPTPESALPILSCAESVREQRQVRLDPREERAYLMIYASGRLPLVREGRVIGSEPLPAPRRHR